MATYFRITAYNKQKNISFIVDSYGAYEKLWQFSSALINKGCEILEVGSSDKFLDGNIPKVATPSSKIILRATSKGTPERTMLNFEGKSYQAIKVDNKTYIPNIEY